MCSKPSATNLTNNYLYCFISYLENKLKSKFERNLDLKYKKSRSMLGRHLV